MRIRLKVNSLCVTFDYHLLHDNPAIIASELKKEFGLSDQDLRLIKDEIQRLVFSPQNPSFIKPKEVGSKEASKVMN